MKSLFEKFLGKKQTSLEKKEIVTEKVSNFSGSEAQPPEVFDRELRKRIAQISDLPPDQVEQVVASIPRLEYRRMINVPPTTIREKILAVVGSIPAPAVDIPSEIVLEETPPADEEPTRVA